MENIRDVQSSILTFKHFSLSLPSSAEGWGTHSNGLKKLVRISVLHIFIPFFQRTYSLYWLYVSLKQCVSAQFNFKYFILIIRDTL